MCLTAVTRLACILMATVFTQPLPLTQLNYNNYYRTLGANVHLPKFPLNLCSLASDTSHAIELSHVYFNPPYFHLLWAHPLKKFVIQYTL